MSEINVKSIYLKCLKKPDTFLKKNGINLYQKCFRISEARAYLGKSIRFILILNPDFLSAGKKDAFTVTCNPVSFK